MLTDIGKHLQTEVLSKWAKFRDLRANSTLL